MKLGNSIEQLRADHLRICCLKYGLPMWKVAEQCGLKPESFSELLRTGRVPVLARAKIEALFGYGEVLWSDPRALLLRKSSVTRTGTDPAVLEKPELKQFARKIGVNLSGVEDVRAAILDACLCHLAANPLKKLV